MADETQGDVIDVATQALDRVIIVGTSPASLQPIGGEQISFHITQVAIKFWKCR
jgi:hypothetical protein